mmetsp:Transcript_39470/g.113897  ORF Transcript_39470/g.113897 Transcript_39470/m.113897 type:complete len:219 (-) Transcript_39470:143-799(-)
MGVLGIHFLLLALRKLGPELILELLEHLYNPTGLELICISLRCVVGDARPTHHAHKGRNQGPRFFRQVLLFRHLKERLLRVSSVVILLLQHCNRTVQGINTLRVILLFVQEVRMVPFTAGCLGLLVRLILGNLVVEFCYGLAKACCVALQRSDLRSEQIYLLRILGYVTLQACRLILTPLGELRKGHLFVLLFLLTLCLHVRQHLNDLLDARNRRALS